MEWIDILQEKPSEGEKVIVMTRARTIHTMTYYDVDGILPYFTLESVCRDEDGYYYEPEYFQAYQISHWARLPFDESMTEEELAADVSSLFTSSSVGRMDAEMFMDTYDVGFHTAHRILRSLVEKGVLKRRRVDNRYVYERNSHEAENKAP